MLGMIKAVLWDFGGVILTSPFEAFRRYETEHDLPLDFIRSVNTTDPHNNAWALMERNEVTPTAVRRSVRGRISGARLQGRGSRCSDAARGRRAAPRWLPCWIE